MIPEKKDSGIERRRFKRTKISIAVMYRKDAPQDVWATDAQAENQAQMFDLSEGGIGIMTNREIPARMVLRLKFTLTWSKNNVVSYYGDLELLGQVRYCGLIGENKYRLGIKFVDIDDSTKTQIRNFLDAVEENP